MRQNTDCSFDAIFYLISPLADEVKEIRAMTKEKVDIVINILKDKSLSKNEKKEGILETIEDFLISV
ncbi:MAG: hypothetical protein Ct9H300mP28_37220 [Pseudomonadota bacterium]|nr:MAG: hypothetical protein Ct9H300mP28_37220 [Pseudomonadota bacterium]